MPSRKAAVRLPNAKNNGKSTTGKYLDDHAELQTGYWKNQVMSIDFMLESLQTDPSDGKSIQNSFKCVYFAIIPHLAESSVH